MANSHEIKENDGLSLKDRYELLIKARNFHYENFNKWMTYFYVAIGALFIGYCSILSKKDSNSEYLNLYFGLLGFILGLLWYWSCKGYYYWNINFITLVNYYEEKLLKLSENNRVYFVFANKNEQNNYSNPISGANISTSKVAILFAFLVTSAWGSLMYYSLLNLFLNLNCCLLGFISFLLSILSVLLISYFVPKKWLKSKIDHFPDLEIKQ